MTVQAPSGARPLSSPMKTRTPGALVQRSSRARISRLREKASNSSRRRSMSDMPCKPIRRVWPLSSMSSPAVSSACSEISTAADSTRSISERVSRNSRTSVFADLRQRPSGEVRVEVIRGLFQLARRIGAPRADDPVLHLVVGEHQDDQDAVAVQRHEIDHAGRRTARAAARSPRRRTGSSPTAARRHLPAAPGCRRRPASGCAGGRFPVPARAASAAASPRTRDSPARSAPGRRKCAAPRSGRSPRGRP